ncbi:molybdenum cofactor biosynthesis protein MoaE [Agromyces protaetiae]|uniref:Molybdenum cofactor biosynthesis protein MoaE n=1 Tax=Agromyces protaetiae TaxID=2509455 RepID=A0A4P6FFT7_9MICO|nr:molybdenum cofactor biosynthesis protein MoaE [Agromyces protaetiae]QAY74765.1 molybdenum cofactor biosynthesis protein MoaE [Agromyces protaetiae]
MDAGIETSASRVVIAAVTDAPLDVAAHLAAVEDARAGAVATFIGVVRDHDPGTVGEVVELDYTAHPDAERFMLELAERFAAPLADVPGDDLPDGADLVRIAVSHRIGTLGVGDLALVCAVATAHRADAFDRCRALVEAIKAELPVWKRQRTADGSTNWVGL